MLDEERKSVFLGEPGKTALKSLSRIQFSAGQVATGERILPFSPKPPDQSARRNLCPVAGLKGLKLVAIAARTNAHALKF